MDDLDHSMRMAEFDWTSFYDECEECGAPQPALACPDDLSEAEDSEDDGSVDGTGQTATRPGPEVNGVGGECEAAAGSATSPVKRNQSGTEGEQVAGVMQVDSEIGLSHPARNLLSTAEVHSTEAGATGTNGDINDTTQTETLTAQCSGTTEETGKAEDCRETELNRPSQGDPKRDESHTADGAGSEDVSGVAPRAEKERWFVTMSYSPARQRVRAASVKTKRRQKKTYQASQASRRGQDESRKNGSDLEMNVDRKKSAGGRDTGGNTKSNQDRGGHQTAEKHAERVSDLLQISRKGDNVSDPLTASHAPKENATLEVAMDVNKQEPGSLVTASHGPLQVETAYSDEFEDGAEFSSVRSYDSECYLSAAESVEETRRPLTEDRPVDVARLRRSASLTFPPESGDAAGAQARQTLSCPSSPCGSVAAVDCGSYECTDAEPDLTFPSAEGAGEMPDDNADARGTERQVLADAPGVQKDKINLSAYGSSSGGQLSPLAVPDVTVTPCSAADTPEAYAKAAGHTRPVFAISAFWDEMEKLTINDILQLRMGRSPPTSESHEPVTANVDDSRTSHSSLGDAEQCGLSDGGLTELSDTADSDYFTQPDESKPGRSSCEFSTSDFEEESWQFTGASRNPSPDPYSKGPERHCESPFSSHEEEEEEEEEEETSSEGKVTPVPSEEDLAAQCSEDQETYGWPGEMTKSKSMHNLHALNKDDPTGAFDGDERSLFLCGYQSVEESLVLSHLSHSLGTLTPAPFLSGYVTDLLDGHYQASYPEVFEEVFTEDEAKNDPRCVTVYSPDDIPVAPAFDCALGPFGADGSFFSRRDSPCRGDRPIPIFSCCPPICGEIPTFPKSNVVVLSAHCQAEEEWDSLSPIRAVSRSFIGANGRGSHSWRSLPSWRRGRFHDRGSIWCIGSGAWVFPLDEERGEGKDASVALLSGGQVPATPQVFRDLAVPHSLLGTKHAAGREGIFSTLKQSDMCLVCIAFASWVLRSSDPENADAWKAALLANVSALSAIQYLRQYVRKKNRPPADT